MATRPRYLNVVRVVGRDPTGVVAVYLDAELLEAPEVLRRFERADRHREAFTRRRRSKASPGESQ
jgi:hypothetical protein